MITLEGEAMAYLATVLVDRHVYRVRIEPRHAGVAIKVNEGTWTPTLSTTEKEPNEYQDR